MTFQPLRTRICTDKAPIPLWPSNTSIRRSLDSLEVGIEGFQAEGSNVLTALYANTPQMGSNASSSTVRTLFGIVLPALEVADLVERTDSEGEGALELGREVERRLFIEGAGAGLGTRWILCLSIVMNSARAPD
jgi:hypothetical protein